MRVLIYICVLVALPFLSACATGQAIATADTPQSGIVFDSSIPPEHQAVITALMDKPASQRRYISAEGKECLWLRAVPDSWIACRSSAKNAWHVRQALILPDTAFGTMP